MTNSKPLLSLDNRGSSNSIFFENSNNIRDNTNVVSIILFPYICYSRKYYVFTMFIILRLRYTSYIYSLRNVGSPSPLRCGQTTTLRPSLRAIARIFLTEKILTLQPSAGATVNSNTRHPNPPP